MEKVKYTRSDRMRRYGARMIIGVAFLLGAAHVADVSRAGHLAAESANNAARKASEPVVLSLDDVVRTDTHEGIGYRLGNTGLTCGHGGSMMIAPGKVLDGQDVGKIRHLCNQVDGWLRMVNISHRPNVHAKIHDMQRMAPNGAFPGPRHPFMAEQDARKPDIKKNFSKEKHKPPSNVTISGLESADGSQKLVVNIDGSPVCDITHRRQVMPAVNGNLQTALDHRRICQGLHRQVHGGERLNVR